jgi:hypothetical protein
MNLYNFLPPPQDQGGTDTCQSYGMIYNIGNYYKMMHDLNLNVTNENFQNVYDQNKFKIKTYYSHGKNILNPLLVVSDDYNCRPTGTDISKIKKYAYNKGLLSYNDFKLNYKGPNVSKNTIKGCSIINRDFSGIKKENKYNPYGNMGMFDVKRDKKDKFSHIKRYLNAGIPLIYYMNATDKFHKFSNKKNTLKFPEISENSIYTETNDSVNESLKKGGLGHITTMIGYVENVPQAKKLDGSNDVFIVMNSWGEDWGDKGCVYITSNMLLSPFTFNVTGVAPNNKYNLYSEFIKVKQMNH